MFEDFGFDPKTLSDNELFNQQVELTRRKTQVAYMGRGDLIAQIDALIQAIETERRERMFYERWNQAPESPVVLETDPALRALETKNVEAPQRPRQVNRPTRRPIRSAKPISPTDDGI